MRAIMQNRCGGDDRLTEMPRNKEGISLAHSHAQTAGKRDEKRERERMRHTHTNIHRKLCVCELCVKGFKPKSFFIISQRPIMDEPSSNNDRDRLREIERDKRGEKIIHGPCLPFFFFFSLFFYLVLWHICHIAQKKPAGEIKEKKRACSSEAVAHIELAAVTLMS